MYNCSMKSTVVLLTPGMLQKMSKKCNSPVIFSGWVVFLGKIRNNIKKKIYKKLLRKKN